MLPLLAPEKKLMLAQQLIAQRLLQKPQLMRLLQKLRLMPKRLLQKPMRQQTQLRMRSPLIKTLVEFCSVQAAHSILRHLLMRFCQIYQVPRMWVQI
jgi:hypothetical protein